MYCFKYSRYIYTFHMGSSFVLLCQNKTLFLSWLAIHSGHRVVSQIYVHMVLPSVIAPGWHLEELWGVMGPCWWDLMSFHLDAHCSFRSNLRPLFHHIYYWSSHTSTLSQICLLIPAKLWPNGFDICGPNWKIHILCQKSHLSNSKSFQPDADYFYQQEARSPFAKIIFKWIERQRNYTILVNNQVKLWHCWMHSTGMGKLIHSY